MRLTMYRGDTATFRITALDATGAPLSLSGATLWFTGKRSVIDSDASAVFMKTIGSGITIVDSVNGIADITLASTDTSSLDEGTILQWDLQVKDAYNGIYTIARGTLRVDADVTNRTS